jgi:hypothetical protein
MEVENYTDSATFDKLKAGDAFAFKHLERVHICIKTFRGSQPQSRFYSCLSLNMGDRKPYIPFLFAEDVVFISGRISLLEAVIFRPSHHPVDIEFYHDIQPIPGLVAVQNKRVFLYASKGDAVFPVCMKTGEVCRPSADDAVTYIKKWSLISQVGGQETVLYTFPE